MKRNLLMVGVALLSCAAVRAQISSPGDVPGLYLSLDADSLGLSDGAAVTSWTDSVHSYDFTGTATYDASYANGHAGVRFNGTSDLLGNTGLSGAPDVGSLTLFIVGSFATTGNDAASDFMVSGQYPAGSNNNRLRILKGNTDGLLDVRVGGGSTVVNITAADTQTHVYSIVSGQTAGAWSFAIDGNTLANGSSGTTEVLQALFLGGYGQGGNQLMDGTISEVLLYDQPLTSQQMTDVNNYLKVNYVPEPGSLSLMVLGAGALIGLRRKQRKC